MDDPAVANATYWLGWMPVISNAAGALVAIGVILEFAVGWISEPWRKIVDDARSLEIAQLSTEAEKANARAREAEKKTEEERLSRVQIEQEIINQLKPRDFKKEQFDAIVDALKGRVKVKLPIFSAPDAESFNFGVAIAQLLKAAQIDAPFTPLTSSPLVAGIRANGVTLYAPGAASNPELRELAVAVCSLTLAKNGLPIAGYSGPEVTPGIPIPSLFVMPKQHPFSWFPAYLAAPPGLPSPPWEPK